MEQFSSLCDAVSTVEVSKFNEMLKNLKLMATFTDDECHGFYPIVVGNEKNEFVRELFKTPANLRFVFGAMVIAMESTGASPESENKDSFNKFLEAFTEQLKSSGRISAIEVMALRASIVDHWLDLT